MKKAATYTASALIAFSLLEAGGAVMTSYQPSHGTTDYGLYSSVQNDDAGEYHSTSLDTYRKLATQIYDLGIHSEPSVKALIDNTFNITIDGTTSKGWNFNVETDGTITTSHISGFPGFDYDQYLNGQTQAIVAAPDHTNLELNGTAGHQAITEESITNGTYLTKDATIVRSDDPILEYLMAPLVYEEKAN